MLNVNNTARAHQESVRGAHAESGGPIFSVLLDLLKCFTVMGYKDFFIQRGSGARATLNNVPDQGFNNGNNEWF